MFIVMFIKAKNELKSSSNLGDKHGNICTQFASRCMHDRSKKERKSEREKAGHC